MVAVQQTDTVRTYQRCAELLTGVEDMLFQNSPLLRLLTETGRDDDEGPDAFLLTEIVHIVGTVFCCHDEYCEVCLWDVLHVVNGLDALHVVFLGVYDVQVTTETAIDDISYNSTTGLMYVVGAANYDDTLWI